MKKGDSVVRVIKKHNNNRSKLEDYYETELMKYSSYYNEINYAPYHKGYKMELHPYKWYNPIKIVDIPYYYISSLFLNKKSINLNNKTSIIIRIVILTIESIFSWLIIELIKSII